MFWQGGHERQQPSPQDVPQAYYGGQPSQGTQAAYGFAPQQAPAAPIYPQVPDVAQLTPGQLHAIIVGAIAEAESRRPKRHPIGASGVLAILAAIVFAFAALELVSTESVDGFYSGVGVMCLGLAVLSIVIGSRD